MDCALMHKKRAEHSRHVQESDYIDEEGLPYPSPFPPSLRKPHPLRINTISDVLLNNGEGFINFTDGTEKKYIPLACHWYLPGNVGLEGCHDGSDKEDDGEEE